MKTFIGDLTCDSHLKATLKTSRGSGNFSSNNTGNCSITGVLHHDWCMPISTKVRCFFVDETDSKLPTHEVGFPWHKAVKDD